MINLKIYHGSTVIVEKPSLEILNYRTDFGKGFYTTTDIEQAKRDILIFMNIQKMKILIY